MKEMIRLRKFIQLDLAIMPNSDDMRQDHHTINVEGLISLRTALCLAMNCLATI
jgi:hypothetical protein